MQLKSTSVTSWVLWQMRNKLLRKVEDVAEDTDMILDVGPETAWIHICRNLKNIKKQFFGMVQ